METNWKSKVQAALDARPTPTLDVARVVAEVQARGGVTRGVSTSEIYRLGDWTRGKPESAAAFNAAIDTAWALGLLTRIKRGVVMALDPEAPIAQVRAEVQDQELVLHYGPRRIKTMRYTTAEELAFIRAVLAEARVAAFEGSRPHSKQVWIVLGGYRHVIETICDD